MQVNRNKKSKREQPASAKMEEARQQILQLESWLPYRLFSISVRVADVLGDFYGPEFGISRAAWRVMAIVANNPGISAKEICRAGGLDQFSVSRAVKQLTELGFAERQAGQSDKRYAAVELSETGWSAFVQISELARHLENELIAAITPEEFAGLDFVLRKLDNASAGVLARGWRNAMIQTAAPTGKSPYRNRSI